MSVTAPMGFRAAGVAAGLKSTGQPDVAVVINDGPHFAAAGVFTRNRVQAAPVMWSRQVLMDGRLQAVVLNSGGANACTGPDGFADTHRTAEHAAAALDIGPIDVAVCSTGLIGVPLDMDRLLPGLSQAIASATATGGSDAAQAIMTTDTVAKTATWTGDGYTIGGMAKGAGMLAPGMATMLCVLTTDAVVSAADLETWLPEAVGRTFDRIDSDGCMSTNDTVIVLASGASGRPAGPEFPDALTSVCADLAGQLINDAEGASKVIAIHVINAVTEDEAVTVARSVARNNLFKCAMYGEDPNWGRVLAAVGTTDAVFDPLNIDVSINSVMVCRGSGVGENRDLVDLRGRQIEVVVDLHAGHERGTVLTNDLTKDYVHENSAYST